jgi:hypothetical protein|tara:strand:- start:249 stop:368 length:120 start_codon:yes stop_codon:yes gene_type:complete
MNNVGGGENKKRRWKPYVKGYLPLLLSSYLNKSNKNKIE